MPIRPTQDADTSVLQEIVSATGLFPKEMLPEMLAPALEGSTPDLWLTLTTGDTPVGFTFTRPEEMAEGVWNMLALAVLPVEQGKGGGKALVKAVEDHLTEAGARLLIVDTSGTEAFAATRAFYTACGYTEEARIRDYWGEGDDKVTFRKALSPKP